MRSNFRITACLISGLFIITFPRKAASEEVVVDGRTYRVIMASPVEGAPLPEPPPQPKTAEELLAEIADLNRQLVDGLRETKQLVDERTAEKPEDIYGLGVGVLIATGEAQLTLDANIKYVFACYYPGKGECLGALSSIEAGQIRYHPLGFGIFRYDDRHDPLSAEFLPRGWDFMVTTGLDVRLMSNLFFRFQAAWFFPNPFDVERYAQDRIEEDLAEWERRHNRNTGKAWDRAENLDRQAPEDYVADEKENTKELRRSIARHTAEASGSYKKAGQKPWFQLALRWEF